MHRHIHALTFTCILLGACGGDKNDTDTEASDSTAGATGTDTSAATDATASASMSSAPTTSGDDGSGSANPTQDGGTATDSTAGGSTTTGATATTDGDTDLMQLCEAFCAKNAECKQADPDGCAADCFDDLGSQEGMCVDATVTLLDCLLGMTCEQFVAFTDEDEAGPCEAPADAAENACAGEVCVENLGSNEQGTECSYGTECPDQPIRDMQCSESACICFEDGQEVGMCPAMGVCMNIDELSTKAMDCCGF